MTESDINEQVRILIRERDAAQAKIEHMRANETLLLDELTQAHMASADALNALHDELAAVNKRIAELSHDVVVAQRGEDEAKVEMERLRMAEAEAMALVISYEWHIDTQDAAVLNLQKQVNDVADRLRERKSELQDACAKVKQRDELAATNERVTELSNWRNLNQEKIRALSQRLQTAKTEMERLNANMDRHVNENSALTSRNMELESEIQSRYQRADPTTHALVLARDGDAGRLRKRQEVARDGLEYASLWERAFERATILDRAEVVAWLEHPEKCSASWWQRTPPALRALLEKSDGE